MLEKNGRESITLLNSIKQLTDLFSHQGGWGEGVMEKVIWIQNKNGLDLGFCDEFNSSIKEGFKSIKRLEKVWIDSKGRWFIILLCRSHNALLEGKTNSILPNLR